MYHYLVNKLRTLTLIFNAFILIGAGHGGAPLVVFEIFSLTDIGEFRINISGQYEDRISTVGLISLVGQIILISSYFGAKKTKSRLTILGCLILLTATFILTKDALDLTIDTFTLFTALPFIVTSLILITKEIRELSRIENS